MLIIENLSNTIHGKKVLKNISLRIKHGEIAVLLGSSGVGKSTLLRVLNNLNSFDSGDITLDGKSFDFDKVNQSHTVGMVFQHFNLFDHLTVKENITLALEKLLKNSKKEAEKTAIDLLKKYGLEDFANSFPADLSGGQKQRLAIARTVALKPKVICFDEPTSALDPMLKNFVAESIQDLAKQGYIVLVASHDIMLLENLVCTIYLMQEGNIVQVADSLDFIKNKENYALINAFIKGR
ncbi:TPA: peptide ABC transporter ATP-binding protein [Candidatus Dependentiae bacterium]|nr:MAG: Amino acid transport ATP-binding protein [candidate division TM6 bacterium GW2011_GWE2_31_21]KKP54093.1 MAG: Amino acid transport ATP-binding protein [candidate division TM6 bacterium GW2011_GWF2_33_332]HBS48325.1 peptide ABC transporter ATP-binding protein [Candidatus Dependentiae bacterium]HBZ73001.1 peptide ABC transporter ATP-binding protein [Candidatus Dependentiae bacterium]